jgi:flagellar assembly protein FliH
MKNIIGTAKINEHSIEPYKFKILGGAQVVEKEEDEEYVQKDSTPIFKEEDEEQEDKEKQQEVQNNKDIEELLKKTDELSSNMVKMQMQMEKQEVEFENRLKAEVQKESESAFAKGYEQAKGEMQASVDEMKNKYVTSIDHLEKEVGKAGEYFKKIENEISSTALEIAKEVIIKEISDSSKNVAIALSHELINDLKDGKNIQIKVNPKDFSAIKDEYKDSEYINVSADDAIAQGGVIVFSDVGNLDGSIATRIQKVKSLIQNNE